jgi:hypothetical protein
VHCGYEQRAARSFFSMTRRKQMNLAEIEAFERVRSADLTMAMMGRRGI